MNNVEKADINSENLVGFPMTIFSLVIGCTMLFLFWSIFHIYYNNSSFEEAIKKIDRVKELRGRIMYFDEVLTMSALMASATGDPIWEQRYNKNVNELDASIKEAISIDPDSYKGDSAKQTDEANLKLVDMETQAFDLVKSGKNEAAHKILSGENYMEQKRIYAAGIENFSKNLDNYIKGKIAYLKKETQITIFLSVGIIPFFVIFWVIAIKKMQKWKRELEASRKSALQSMRVKSEFLANMSHEIRTPLNGIMGMTRLILDSNLTSEQRGCAEIVYQSADSLLEIINDILDFSKIEEGKLELEIISFNIHSVIQEVTDLLVMKTREKKIEFLVSVAPDIPEFLMGDPGRIRQILLNLIGNAVKFTSQGHVLLRIVNLNKDPGNPMLSFEIEDTGIGIPEDKTGLLFQKFTQADSSTTRKFGGTGLGLSISKYLVEMMGGEIGVRSVIRKGSTFWFNIPLKPGKREEINASIPAHDFSGLKALIIDDYPVGVKILQEYLSRWKINSEYVTVAEDAINMITKASAEGKPFHFVLIDEKLPGMNGLTLVEKIKEKPELKDIILVMITSLGNMANMTTLKQKGLSGFLLKPFYPQQIYTILQVIWDAKIKKKDIPLVTRHTIAELLSNKNIKASLVPKKQFFNTKILVVEDVYVNQILMATVLKKLGCSVDIAANGVEAVDMFKKFPYKVILMDCQMPEMDGFTATYEIRKAEPSVNRRATIVALTADAMEGTRDKCIQAGMDDYLYKPIKIEKLEEILDKYIKTSDPSAILTSDKYN